MPKSKPFNCPLTATTVTLSWQRLVIPGAISRSNKMQEQFDHECSVEDNCPHKYQPECRVQHLNNQPVYQTQ